MAMSRQQQHVVFKCARRRLTPHAYAAVQMTSPVIVACCKKLGCCLGGCTRNLKLQRSGLTKHAPSKEQFASPVIHAF